MALIFSINIHEQPGFLMKQLENIKENVNVPYKVLLHCNNYMFEECNRLPLEENIIVHPHILEKKRHHGSLLQGMVENMEYALEHFPDFEFFIILSSCNLFFKPLNMDYLKSAYPRYNNFKQVSKNIQHNPHLNKFQNRFAVGKKWHWKKFSKTDFGNYFLKNGYALYGSPHEGLVFSNSVVKQILLFFNNNSSLKTSVFHIELCMEELVLQTIATNNLSMFHKEFHFMNIGRGCDREEKPDVNDAYGYLYKTTRT